MAGQEWVAACLAVVSAGAVVVPLDAQLGDDTLRHALEDRVVPGTSSPRLTRLHGWRMWIRALR